MSKYDLRSSAHALSGVSYESSLLVKTSLNPPILEIIGGIEGVRQLSTLFYDRVFADVEMPWFRGIFASSTKAEAIDNQYRYLVQEVFGGPMLYREKGKGKYARLVGRHANYKIGTAAAKRWMHHMEGALDEHDMLKGEKCDLARSYLRDYFQYTAYYIVVASEYMKDDQLSGGTQLDSGRIW